MFFNYHGRLVLFANKFIRDMQVSRDLVQDAFFTLWEKADQLEGKQSPKAYLFQAVKNSCFNYNRLLAIKQSARDNLVSKMAELEKTVYQNYDSPYYSLIELELEKKIAAFIESMPAKCQQVFKPSSFEYLKNKEIAVQGATGTNCNATGINYSLHGFEMKNYLDFVYKKNKC